MKAYLLDLTTGRAFHLFFLALSLGALCTWFDAFLPWLPAIFVLAYGGVLLYAEKALLVSHSETTKNSPYFLGFLLTLIALFAVFYTRPPERADLAWGFLVRQLGSALLTTIVGLAVRQSLFAYAPAQQEEDKFFRTIEEELRRSASQFRKTQDDFVQLLQEFIATREVLFSEEEKASRRYVENLTRAITVFDQVYDGYPKQISSTLSKFAKRVDVLAKKIEEMAEATGRIDSTAFTEISQRLEGFQKATSQVSNELDNLRHNVVSLRDVADQFPGRIEQFASDAANRSRVIGTQLGEVIDSIHRDLQAIDSILSDFVRVIQKHISVR